MDRLWAPWRGQYIKRVIKDENKVCVFCRIIKQKADKKNHILFRWKTCYAVLNIYPYNNGHALVLPNRHVSDIALLTKEEKLEQWEALEEVKRMLDKVIRPAGYNIGINLGKVSGAGFPGHLHIHIVPRWKGDANFMPIISDTRVLSQSLDSIYRSLTHAYKKRR